MQQYDWPTVLGARFEIGYVEQIRPDRLERVERTACLGFGGRWHGSDGLGCCSRPPSELTGSQRRGGDAKEVATVMAEFVNHVTPRSFT
jgi:hypothetical protein